MKTTIATPEFYITGFSATHIIFDNSNDATIWAKCRINDVLQDVHISIGFDKLNDLMRFSGSIGEKIILSMVDEMMQKANPPYIISLKNIIGTAVAFTTVKLVVLESSLLSTSTNKETFCITVKEVWPINIIEQAKNLVQHAKDFTGICNVSDAVVRNSITQLKAQYHYYLGLLELDIKEASCREKSNLSDDRLFAMAKSSWEKY
jgi:hypothetical protein